MISQSSVFPEYIFDQTNDKDIKYQLSIHVLTIQQLQIMNVSQKYVKQFIDKKICTRYKQNLRQVFLSSYKCSTFKIQESCSIQFSKQVQKLSDFSGIVAQILTSSYSFSRKSQKKQSINIYLKNSRQKVQPIVMLAKAKTFSKEIANSRGPFQGTPQYFLTKLNQISEKHNLEKTIIKGNQLLQNGFRLLHAVGRGSIHQPIFVNIAYNGNKSSDKYVAFIGKGVCFDAGGYDIKQPAAMKIMYLDKQGASSVLAAFQQVVQQQLQVNLTCSIGLVQNVIGPYSYHPGDIIKSRKGITVKIQDTDAEGRLVLADAMHWTQQKFNIDTMIELSTLTYSNIVALGHKYTGLFTNNQQLSDDLTKIGRKVHQYVWRMPLDQQHHQLLQCEYADCINDNVEGCPGGSIAAAFLQKFVQKGTKWAHLDIAGPAIINEMGTGWGAILLIQFLRQKSLQSQFTKTNF